MEMFAKLACIAMLCMVVFAPHAEAALTCSQVTNYLSPCLTYLTKGGTVQPYCCSGVKGLNSAATSTPDRQAACKCMKSLSGSVTNINANYAASLPGKCGVSIPYKISPNVDCSKVV